jgi:hypothetical protein
MDTIQQSRNPAEMKGVIDSGNGIPSLDGFPYGSQESKLMDNLYSILTLSLIFYERIIKPFESERVESVLFAAREPGIES